MNQSTCAKQLEQLVQFLCEYHQLVVRNHQPAPSRVSWQNLALMLQQNLTKTKKYKIVNIANWLANCWQHWAPFKINKQSRIHRTIYELNNVQFYELFTLKFGTSVHCSLVFVCQIKYALSVYFWLKYDFYCYQVLHHMVTNLEKTLK